MPHSRRKSTCQGRGKGNLSRFDSRPRKEGAQGLRRNSRNGAVSRVVEGEVVPEEHPARPKNTGHLGGDLASHPIVQNRSKNSGLRNDVERFVRPRKGRRVPGSKVTPGKTMAGHRGACLVKLDSRHLFSVGAELDQKLAPATFAESDVEDRPVPERNHVCLVQRPKQRALLALAKKEVARVCVGVVVASRALPALSVLLEDALGFAQNPWLICESRWRTC